MVSSSSNFFAVVTVSSFHCLWTFDVFCFIASDFLPSSSSRVSSYVFLIWTCYYSSLLFSFSSSGFFFCFLYCFLSRFLLSLCFHLLLLLLFHLLLHLHSANSSSLLMFHLKNSLFIISSCFVSTISYQPTRSPCFYHQVPGMAAMASRVRIQQKGHPEMAVESVPNSALLSAQTWCLVFEVGLCLQLEY